MAVDLTIRNGDTLPPLTAVVTDQDGNPVDLTAATVTFVMRQGASTSPKVNAAMSITSAATGQVQYNWSATDTNTTGLYNAEIHVVESGGGTYTYPNVGYLSVEVEGSLIGAPTQLVSVADAKDVLNFLADDDVHDTKILRWINACRPLIETLVGPIIPTLFEEWHDGGFYELLLRRRPSTALGTSPVLIVNAVSEYNGPIEWPLAMVSSPDQGVLYSVQVDNQIGRIVRRTAGGGVQAFPNMPQSTHVWYTAGQLTVPDNVYEATLELLRQNYQQTAQMSRSQFGGGSGEDAVIEYTGNMGFFVPGRVRELLSPNRRFPSLA